MLRETDLNSKNPGNGLLKTIVRWILPSERLRRVAKYIISAKHRSEYLADKRFKNNYFQKETYTNIDRYPALFAQCQAHLKDVQNPRILSFGCSTGEEVFTLGEYLPGANIMGIDINDWCLQQCKKKYPENRFTFCHRFSDTFLRSEDFDVICCLAVFQRTENRNPNNIKAQGLTFEKFEAEITLLDKKLKPGGLMIIDNADFSFSDTRCSRGYKPLDFEKNQLLRLRPLFGSNNQKIADEQRVYRVFVKI